MVTHPSDYMLKEYDYELPLERIAQLPAPERDQSRLLVLKTSDGSRAHRQFKEILDYFHPGDLLVANATKVFPARLMGRRRTGGKIELFLLSYPAITASSNTPSGCQEATAQALIKSSKRPKQGEWLLFSETLQARVDQIIPDGEVAITLRYKATGSDALATMLETHGQMPLPPYISRPSGSSAEDRHRYQTRYARHTGSVAAPTAGLHFSDAVLTALQDKGVRFAHVILHVGYGTFAPVRCEDIREHVIHSESVQIPAETAEAVNQTKKSGGRIWAVGTTSVRALEFAAEAQGTIKAVMAGCNLFIYPGFQFRVIDNLITNFHLPKSSLLFLISALAGRALVLEAYQEAIAKEYRFFSYGDAMAIITRP